MRIDAFSLIWGMVVVFVLGMITTVGIYDVGKMTFKDEIIDDVCKQLTGNESAIAEQEYQIQRRLICVLPSFDDTQNIIIKTNDKEECE